MYNSDYQGYQVTDDEVPFVLLHVYYAAVYRAAIRLL
jgi:hypothetical protein